MIFVTVGTDEHDFSRLIKAMDVIGEKQRVVMQIGHSQTIPKHAEWFRFTEEKRLATLYRTAEVIVTHGGAGSIIRSLSQGKIPLVVPRRVRWNEHVNDHQADLARRLGKEGRVIVVENVANLKNALQKRLVRLGKKPALAEHIGRYLHALS